MTRARSIRTATPGPSNAVRDKLMAALRYTYGGMAARGRKTTEYVKAPLYCDSLWAWYQTLNADQQELVSDISTRGRPRVVGKAAEQWASHLPPAPQFPREVD